MNGQKLKFVESVTSLSGVYIWYYNYFFKFYVKAGAGVKKNIFYSSNFVGWDILNGSPFTIIKKKFYVKAQARVKTNIFY